MKPIESITLATWVLVMVCGVMFALVARDIKHRIITVNEKIDILGELYDGRCE